MFAALVAATVAAIFLTQHLKVSLPLLQGYPNPVPAAFNPVSGRVCKTAAGRVIDFSKTWISFTLAKSDTVDAYIFNSAGQLVDTVRTGQPIPAQVRSPRFYWGGKQSNGEYAPAGTYYWRFVLEHENRTIELTNKPIQVITTVPHPVVTSVRLTGSSATAGPGGGGAAAAGPPIITPKKQSVTIHFTKADYQEAMVMLWRTDGGKAHLATEWPVANPTLGVAAWNGWIHGSAGPGRHVPDRAQGSGPGLQPGDLADRAASGHTPAWHRRDRSLSGCAAAARAGARRIQGDRVRRLPSAPLPVVPARGRQRPGNLPRAPVRRRVSSCTSGCLPGPPGCTCSRSAPARTRLACRWSPTRRWARRAGPACWSCCRC